MSTAAQGDGPITTPQELRPTLQRMVDVLQGERQALAGLDLDGIIGAAWTKNELCERLNGTPGDAIDEECRGLLVAARHLNDVNRQLRNLIAANVSARLEALTGQATLYHPRARAYAYAPAHS